MSHYRFQIMRTQQLRDGMTNTVDVAGFMWAKDAEDFFKTLPHDLEHFTYKLYRADTALLLVRDSEDEIEPESA